MSSSSSWQGPGTGAISSPAANLADKGTRVAGYLIDVVPAIVIGLLALIPIVGIIFAGLLLTPYWLLRDVAGASLGKIALGMRIVKRDGSPAGVGSRVLRNLPLAIGPSLLIIPLLGYALGPPVIGVIVLLEAILLLSTGERLGDRLAGTIVVRK